MNRPERRELPVRIDFFTINPDRYSGTREGIVRLRAIIKTLKFREQYPHHLIYTLGSEVVAAHPNRFAIPPHQYQQVSSAVVKGLKDCGIDPRECAIIQTSTPNMSTNPGCQMMYY